LTENDGAGVNAQSYAYHASSTVVTDALGRKTIHEFINRQGMKKPSRIIDAHGGVTKFEYDADFNLSAQTDPLGRVLNYGRIHPPLGQKATRTDSEQERLNTSHPRPHHLKEWIGLAENAGKAGRRRKLNESD